MDLKQLERNTIESLSNATRVDNIGDGEIETDQILDQEETAEINSMDGADAGTHWAPKQAHIFYFVKFGPYELDKRMQCKIEQCKLESQRRRMEIDHFKKELVCIKSKRSSLLCELRNLTSNVNYIRYYPWNSEFVEHMQDILKKESKNNGTSVHQSKEDELFDLIKEKHIIRKDSLNSGEGKRITYLNHRIRNQRLTSKEETAMLKLIKELETTRDKAIDGAAEASLKTKKFREYGIRREISWRRQRHKSIEEYVQFHVNNLERLNQQLLESLQKISHLQKHLEAVDRQIQKLEQKINSSNLRMEKAHSVILNSKNLLHNMNSGYLQNCELLQDADALAQQNDLSALTDLSNSEIEKFFLQWRNNKDFKEDYKSRIIPSLENRGLSRDGRVANLNQI